MWRVDYYYNSDFAMASFTFIVYIKLEKNNNTQLFMNQPVIISAAGRVYILLYQITNWE